MKIKILVFGILTDIFKGHQLVMSLPENISVKVLKEQIYKDYPQTASLNFAVAVDEAYADDDIIINKNQTIALIPPVSGG
ncbi:MAG: MoaD/ThiS family protein [Flavobacteriales bacterium]|jgi:molybdopterin converting factor small subunit|nr:MoaD/ThiS family protein [Flavobacteriales bacterium]